MKIVKKTSELEVLVSLFKELGLKIGLVPTMGALHNGHASLVKKAVAENDVVIVSVFVNPTQFNNKNDLATYPRTVEADCALLESLGANIAFTPTVEQIYPYPDTRQFDFTPLDKVMEGPMRPGHFNGVAQVVSRLFDIAQPNKAYFGEKDYQQLAIIREMVRQFNYPIEIVGCPIIREADGMALSSRNTLLSANERQTAVRISQTLAKSQSLLKEKSVKELQQWVIDEINRGGELEVEYYEIVNGTTLQPINSWNDCDNPVGCITVYCGKVRLIDNIQYKK
ncbi:MAG: pantoate--beta-alanine ligase [Paludibacteraceae bacterium]|jgi:pantoate--beta-alanine ligase|nr:pantoate--beta-alanine ligase [Paludibacteraceae bacterium]MEE1260786.1 pantoate--beta-alanine ligase [Paludibacteraceae bacterium]